MKISDFLAQELVPALGCTEPASIALAVATAVAQGVGDVERVQITCDPQIYKNCYAVGIPNSEHHTGILWSIALGAQLKDAPKDLECFSAITPAALEAAGALIDAGAIEVEVDAERRALFIDAVVEGTKGRARCIIQNEHTNIVRVEHDDRVIEERDAGKASSRAQLRADVAALSLDEMLAMVAAIGEKDRAHIREAMRLNRVIAEHGMTLFPKRFVALASGEAMHRSAFLVCAGVYARMSGEGFPVMSLAGSGNKGITATVPLAICAQTRAIDETRLMEALALAYLVTSATTHHLGSLSAVCGCSNAAGIGLAAGLIHLDGGGVHEIELAQHNMVGNVTGMICDGAKIGCALKTMTAVDAAFRASALAMGGVGIPPEDGIVGATGRESLENVGRIATLGMSATDGEILKIMQEKLAIREKK